MKATLTRDFYKYSDYNYIEYPEVNVLIGTKDIYAQGFSGKRSKPDFNLKFRSIESRDAYIEKYLKGLKETQEYKAKYRAENKGKLTGSAAAAVEIRKALKKCFPDTKFSVRSQTFSTGDSVDVSWTDGPMTKLVDSVISLFEYGRFDAMQDLSYNVDIDSRLKCGGAKYVHAHRELSSEYQSKIQEILKNEFIPYHQQWSTPEYAPFQREEAEVNYLGKSKEWLEAECKKIQELVLEGPIAETPEEVIEIPEEVIEIPEEVIEIPETPTIETQELTLEIDMDSAKSQASIWKNACSELRTPEEEKFLIDTLVKLATKDPDEIWENSAIKALSTKGNVIDMEAWKLTHHRAS